MFDGFWSGMFGGLFGPVIAEWLGKFKYRVIFLVTTVSSYVGLYIVLIYTKGLAFATQAMLKNMFTLQGAIGPIVLGSLAVVVAFIGSLSTSKKSKNTGQDGGVS